MKWWIQEKTHNVLWVVMTALLLICRLKLRFDEYNALADLVTIIIRFSCALRIIWAIRVYCRCKDLQRKLEEEEEL